MTTDTQTPLDLFLDLINPVKHYCTNQIWGAVIRMFPGLQQLRLCSARSKQQPSSLVSWDFPSPLSQHHWIPVSQHVGACASVRARAFVKCVPQCAPVSMCMHTYLCSTLEFEKTPLLIHTGNRSYGVGPTGLAAREFIRSFVHIPNSKVTTDYLYIFHNTHTHTHTFVGEAAACFLKSSHHFFQKCTNYKGQFLI